MNVCLISPPTVTDFEDPAVAESDVIRLIAEHAPIGILSLAAVLEAQGITPTVVDLNWRYYDYLRSEAHAHGDFCSYIVREFEAHTFDLIGFSTICSTYPLTIRMAQAIKQARPETTVVLGGPQASVVDVQTLKAFPHIDYIVRGEAEETLPRLLDALAGNGPGHRIPGITYRQRGEVVRNPNAPVVADLDSLPLPAFHLYPHIEQCHYIPLELGRGCPFACSFCSTNDFFRRNFRLKSPPQLIAQMKHIQQTYHIDTFDLIHDMFTVNRKKVVEFCEALLESGEKFHWNCSARTDCVDEELIALMAKSGCRGIFFGIESGSARMQTVINKKLDLAESERMIQCCDRHEVTTAVSLIYGFPEETKDDIRDTIGFMMDALRYDYAAPQLHILAPLAETPIHTQYRNQMAFDDILSDMSYQGWRQDPVDREMIQAYPDIFPNFYSVPTPYLDRPYLKELRDFVLKGMVWFRWLLVALHQDTGDLLAIFDAWRAWRIEKQEWEAADSAELSRYYEKTDFYRDFLAFVQTRCLDGIAKTPRVIAALVDYEHAVGNADPDRLLASQPAAASDAAESALAGEAIQPDLIPQLAESVRLAKLNVDYQKMIACLRRRGRLKRVPAKPVVLVTRRAAQRSYQKQTEILQVSPLSAQLLHWCDGSRTVREITDLFLSSGEAVDDIPADKVCLFGLEMLRQQNLIVVGPRHAAT